MARKGKTASRDRQQSLAGFDEQPAPTATPPATSPPTPVTPSSASQATRLNQPAPASSHQPLGTPSLASKTVYVVDAHSLIYQVFHALPEMMSPTGQPVGAVHGFTRDILDILENKQPDYLFCAFDHHGDTFRHSIYDRYKIQRQAMPEDLRPQIPNIQRMLAALGVPALSCETFEADDILATFARFVAEQEGSCYLVTGDKDCRQLIGERAWVYNIRKNQNYDAEALRAEWGIRPDQVIDFQSLVGDTVDNIPGVPLIGPKLARELLEKYGTLEEVLAHADEVAGTKRRENLKAFGEQALMSRRLVRLRDDVPVEIDWQAGRVGGIDREKVQELCREFGFRSLAERLGKLTVTDAPAAWTAIYTTVGTKQELADLAAEMLCQKRIVLDTETTAIEPRFAEIVGYSFAWQPGVAYYVPVRAPQGEPQIPPAEALEILRPVFESPVVQKVGQNLKYDMVVLRAAGVDLQGLAFDTMVADYLLDPGERNHNLDDLAKRYLNHDTIKIEELIGKGKEQKRMDQVPVELITRYAAEDADVPMRLLGTLERRLQEEGLSELFATLEMPLVEVLVELEFNGIRIDVPRLQELSRRFGERLATLETEIYELVGRKFNIESPKQLAEILFTQFKLPVIKKTKTGASTDVEVLVELAKQHPLPAKIIDYRQNAKLKSTYVDALPQLVHPQTLRVHTSFKQDVAATGRLSSTDPNLQNIPVRTEAGREIRSAFLPGPPGWKLLCADYSQIELRVLAHFSGDATLKQAFANDEDIHTRVASEVYEVPPDQVTREMRRSAKAINFGVIYGQSAFGLAKSLDIEKDEATRFIDAYFARYPGVDAFMDRILADARRQGYVSTISGRRRVVQGVRDAQERAGSRQRILPERIAVNTVIQGSAADLIKMAMISVLRRLRSERLEAKLLLQIHDELVFEAHPEELAALKELVVSEMSRAGELSVPLKVDVKTGDNWADCEPA
jgi:DNA polymerase-1